MSEALDPQKLLRPTAVPASPALPAKPRAKPKRETSRPGMNKTGARILGGFAAALISWLWSGWGEPATGVAMGDAMLTSLGGAMIVAMEWLLVKDSRQ